MRVEGSDLKFAHAGNLSQEPIIVLDPKLFIQITRNAPLFSFYPQESPLKKREKDVIFTQGLL